MNKRSMTIEILSAHAASNGGRILDTEYRRVADHYRWECHAGHRWQATATNVLTHGSWCPTCAMNRPMTIERLQQVAKQRGGECLTTRYNNSKARMRWRCARGHSWLASAMSVVTQGSWCAQCQKDTIDAMHQLAKARAWRCLSEIYNNNYTPLEWQCAFGHRFHRQPRYIKAGRGCPICIAISRRKSKRYGNRKGSAAGTPQT